ncbi:hypothetical protein K439DRAFT_1665423 [Ramaria rubella]|nr:hypothetical protein K439DRAFT_1665423 [Ramaria rubella]
MEIHQQQASKLCALPEELLVHILGLAHPVTLIACRAVCKLLLKTIEGAVALQYHIELYADGMVDGERCRVSMAEKLSQLRIRRQAWKDMKWEHRHLPLIPGSWNAYELVDGVFSKTLNSVEHNSARGILFANLPSRHQTGSLTIFEDLGLTFRDFAMDPTQDLIIYMQCTRVSDGTGSGLFTKVTLHFRTISGNKVHPCACQATVTVTFPTEVLGAVIQTVDEIVGFMSWDNERSQFHIWDWRRCMRLVSETDLPALDDFAFVSNRAYVLTSSVPAACFRLYMFNMNPNGYDSPSLPTLRATLHLPPMWEGATATLLGIHTGPFTTMSPYSLRPPRPFSTASYARIHTVNIDLSSGLNDGEPTVSCLIVIRNKTFLAYVEEPGEVGDISWKDWGAEETRWIPGGTGSLWLRYVHGERLVRMNTVGDNGERQLEVYDFGAPRGPLSWTTPDEYISMHQPHALHLETVFTAPVVFQLPCRIVTKREVFPYSGFMVDEDRLIGLKRHWNEDATSVDVFTF